MGKLPAVAVAGSGDIARYLAEEFVRDGQHDFHIISRTERPWFSELGIQYHLAPRYSKENLVELFDKFEISTIISTLTAGDVPTFVSLHQDILDACRQSSKCKRLIPSDFIGNVERFPDLPRRHADSRHAFREILAQQSEVEWTTVNQGWLMDYFVHLPSGQKTYIRPYLAWPLDLEKSTCRLPGTGDDRVTWTSARDLSKAVVQLVKHPKWDRYTYVYGETGTWLEVIPKVEKLLNLKIERIPASREEIEKTVQDGSDPNKQYIASIDEWTVAGAGLVPMDVAEKQRAKFFDDVKFRTIEELIQEAQLSDAV
ncbi:hypothetical protein NW754_010287 [Fusarium falciforme]|uniref:NmrA-like domain-containing protein n=1 Tax=Fusarium falciforme TaxID=195108 RepID=A0A9W8QVE6_9HYPO|nr:hypothetical protein NW754_010287 [Fusarium falciforme]KAJ4177483.1 hypothetical protein NW755_013816 [Fusarium falciforme]KAJ4235462.1 hypothetical protein NW757_013503 [Fusarium falciforme]